ncbi:MAG TPA: hypothetical protein VJV75_08015, partial [Candidatus Polarisedimenticolia bacterium]|nr:hypothetical protein [Candidatus Polarisedimenticolia bacterium]
PPAGGEPAAGARLSAPLPSAAAPNVIPLMPDFWAFWDRAEGKPAAERVALLKEVAIAPHRDFYEKVVGVPSDERLTEFLEVLGPAIPALRRIDGEFRTQLPGAWKSFIAVYPDLDRSLPLYVGPSLFTSSGQSRDLDGKTIVFYGLDVVAVVLGDVTDHRPDIHHEMFHAYHWQRNPAMAAVGRDSFSKTRTSPMYNDLWTEGLALYSTRRLSPDAPLSIILSSKDLPEKGPAVLSKVAGELRQKLDVTNLDEVGDYFFYRTRRTDLPSRSAYFVGLRLAETVAKTKSMDEMLALQGDALRRVVDDGLATLSSGS